MTRIPVPNSMLDKVLYCLDHDKRILTDLWRYVNSTSEVELRLSESDNDSLFIRTGGMDRAIVYLPKDLALELKEIIS